MTIDDHLDEAWPRAEAPTEIREAVDDRLVAFLYRLMRDHLPVGVVRQITVELEDHDAFVLSSPPLAYLAREIAEVLRR